MNFINCFNEEENVKRLIALCLALVLCNIFFLWHLFDRTEWHRRVDGHPVVRCLLYPGPVIAREPILETGFKVIKAFNRMGISEHHAARIQVHVFNTPHLWPLCQAQFFLMTPQAVIDKIEWYKSVMVNQLSSAHGLCQMLITTGEASAVSYSNPWLPWKVNAGLCNVYIAIC